MREIVSIQVGQAGNQVYGAFWETITKEHGLDRDGHLSPTHDVSKENLDVFFNEAASRKYVPRSVAVDLEPGTLDMIRSGPLGNIFRPDNLIAGTTGAGNNWAKGYYTEGAELVDETMEVIRREVEQTDSLQGFQIAHSLGGGTGSGMGTLILGRIKDEYSDRMVSTYSVLPSPKVSETVTEPYNAALALNQLIETSDATFCLDNEALYNICMKTLQCEHPTHNDLNKLIAKAMSGVTTCLRYHGQLNGDLRKLAVNLVPFSRLHFFTTSYAPLFAAGARAFQHLSVQEITQQLFNPTNIMAECNPYQGRYLTISTIYRGKVSLKEVEDCNAAAHARHRDLFVDWIPNNFQTSVCNKAPEGLDISATSIANTTSVRELFSRTITQFHSMFRRKAFLHWYTNEGMDEAEFTEAYSNLLDLVQDYDQYQVATADDDYEAEYEPGVAEDVYSVVHSMEQPVAVPVPAPLPIPVSEDEVADIEANLASGTAA